MGKSQKKRLEESIEVGKALKFLQNVEIQFQGDALKDLQEKNKSFILTESEGSTKTTKRKLTVVVEGIHTGMTKNMTFYPGNALEESVPTWTTPHRKPVLKNHNMHAEPLGRITQAEYVESSLTDKYTVRLTLELTDQDAIDKVLDGRYLTLSVGGSANKVVCSVCAKDLIQEGFCGHWRGRKYEGKTAHWIIGNYTGDEISFVNMPADVHSQVIAAELVSGEGGKDVKTGKKPNESADENKPNVTESESDLDMIDGILGEGDEGDIDDNPGKPNESDDNPDNDNPENPTESDNDDDDKDNPGKPNESDDGGEGDEGDGDDPENPTESVESLKEELEAEKQKNKDLQKKLDEADADNVSLSADLTEAEESIKDLKKKLHTAEENLESAETEKKTFESQSIKLARFARKMMAERVVDLRIMHGKDKEEDRDTLISEWMNSSSKVLETTIKDLIKTPRQMAQVNSPGYVVDNNDDEDENGDRITETDKKKTKRLTLADFEKTMVESVSRQNY